MDTKKVTSKAPTVEQLVSKATAKKCDVAYREAIDGMDNPPTLHAWREAWIKQRVTK